MHTQNKDLFDKFKEVDQMSHQKEPSLEGDLVRNETKTLAFKAHTEDDLILEDISEEDLSKTTATDTENVAGDVDSLHSFTNRFYNLRYRECPLTIPRNMEGLVDGYTFWKDSNNFRNGLYDSCQPENKVQTLKAVTFPVKQMNSRLRTQIPNNDPKSISIMAQYLYNQMAEHRAEMDNNIKCVEAADKNDIEELGSSCGPMELKSRDQEGPLLKKKSLGARVMGFLRKMCCCVKMNEGE